MTNILNVTFNAAHEPRFPVFCQFGGQYRPQSAYITLNLENGECTAWTAPFGGGIPEHYWNNIVLTFSIPSTATADELETIIETHKAEFQEILDGAEIRWSGGSNRGILNENAQSVYDSLSKGDKLYSESTACRISDSEDLANYFGDEVYIKDTETIEDYESRLSQADGSNNYFFADNFNVLSGALYLYEQMIHSFDTENKESWIPKIIAQELLDRETTDYEKELSIIISSS